MLRGLNAGNKKNWFNSVEKSIECVTYELIWLSADLDQILFYLILIFFTAIPDRTHDPTTDLPDVAT